MNMITKITSLLGLVVISATLVVVSGYQSQTANAIDGKDFNPGRIIDDSVFYNSQAMDTAQIQRFLESKAPNCDYNGTQPASDWGYPNITHAQLAEYKRNGTNGFSLDRGFHAPPYKCMSMYTQVTPQMEAASGYCSAISSGSRSAAQIINDVSKACDINPQVLVILLEKEQSLVTDSWPLDRQLRNATGFACPDTAPCDPAYEGFFYQVYHAARQFKVYQANPNSYNYISGRTNRVYWQTNLGNFINPTGNVSDPSRANQSACGYQNVYIENQATAALYIYTPYQPNQAALNNLRGTGDGCSAYGNRNFWRLFNDWFGSTYGIPKSNIYLDEGEYTLTNPGSNKSLDAIGAGTKNGTRIQIYTDNNTSAQKWHVSQDSEGYYSLKNINSGKYLDVANSSSSPGAYIQLWDHSSSCSQKWSVVMTSIESVNLISKCSGLTLDITNGVMQNGTRLQTWGRNMSKSQEWVFVSQNKTNLDGFYTIDTPSNLTLDIDRGILNNGSAIQIYTKNNSSGQFWHIDRQRSGLYTIRNAKSEKNIDLVNANISSGSSVQLFHKNTSCAQLWSITKTSSDHSYTIRSSCSDKVLDVRDGLHSTPSTKVQIWDKNSTPAQQWILTGISSNLIPEARYTISTPGGKNLDVTGGLKVSGTPIQIFTKNQTSSQIWQLVKNTDDTYSLVNPASTKYVDLIGGRSNSGTQIQLWDWNGGCGQRWNITSNSNGTHTLLSACQNSHALDVSGGLIDLNGSKVQVYSSNNSKAQMWNFDAP